MRWLDATAAFERLAPAVADLVADLDPDARVPDCPDWAVRDLVRHLGGIQRWATRLVGDGVTAETWRASMDLDYPVADASSAELADWLRASSGPLVEAFRTTDPETPVWVWGNDQHARWWAPRMLFEVVVHGGDAAGAGPLPFTVEPWVAAAGVEEHLQNLPWTGRWESRVRGLVGAGEQLALRATDDGSAWRLRFEPHGWWWERGDLPADASVSGAAVTLLRWLTGRPGDVVVDGDAALVARTLRSLAF